MLMSKNLVAKESFAATFQKKMAKFQQLNADFDVDFVEMGMQLKLTKTGKFQVKDNEDIIFDKITGVLIKGTSQYVLWGEDGTPYADKGLLVNTETLEEAEAAFEQLAAEDEMFE